MSKRTAIKPNDRSHPLLDEESIRELELALNDGFMIASSSLGGDFIDLNDIVYEPHFRAEVRGRHPRENDVRSEFNKTLSVIQDPVARREALETFLEENSNEDGPDWRDSNPFGFDVTDLIKFFGKRFQKFVASRFCSGSTSFDAIALLRLAEPFSMEWFELQIFAELEFHHSLMSEFKQDRTSDDPSTRRTAEWKLYMAVQSIGKVGRLVEHYRWRFVHGQNAITGKKSREGASEGGKLRKNKTGNQTAEVLKKMQQFIDRGLSIARAAELAANRGIGTSKAANRKLWYDHNRKAEKY